ncbi:MAG: hypothetical protein U9N45_03345, partial [Gemmatimonadota bacterium]|nr:hypothetical protein [Gemmatimonadota bacterium]
MNPFSSRGSLAAMPLSTIYSLFLLLFIFAVDLPARGHPLTFDDLLRVRRISQPAVSPDGRWVAFVQTTYDSTEYEPSSDIFILPLAGGRIRALTAGGRGNGQPMFTPDGKSLIFASTRTGSRQFFLLPLKGGGEAVQITSHESGAHGGALSPDGELLLYHATVLVDSLSVVGYKGPDSTPRARIIDNLLFRHWDHWREGSYSHLFCKRIRGDEKALDLTPGRIDCPPVSLGSDSDYGVGSDGRHVYYTANSDPVVALSTNNDIWRVGTDGRGLVKITENPANDNLVALSPDGRYLAYRAMARPGF